MARLDRIHVGECARNRGGKIQILEGFNILSNHLPVLTTIHTYNNTKEQTKYFKFNTSFLEEENLKQKINEIWNESL